MTDREIQRLYARSFPSKKQYDSHEATRPGARRAATGERVEGGRRANTGAKLVYWNSRGLTRLVLAAVRCRITRGGGASPGNAATFPH